MKLRNKKTGEIIEVDMSCRGGRFIGDNSLAELCEEWADYEEPTGKIENIWSGNRREKTIHIKCDTEKYAKEILLKLKAWERLKDKGFGFNGWDSSLKEIFWEMTSLEKGQLIPTQIRNDLDLLFGGNQNV